jgi:hypothetical protein
VPSPGFLNAAARRLCKRPQGATIADVQQATDLPDDVVASRLGQMVRSGTLRRELGKPVRFFLSDKEKDRTQ